MPDTFALIGITASFIFILEMLTDAGFRSYILKQEGLYEGRALDNLWTLHFLRGILLYFVLLILAYPISLFFDIDGLYQSILIMSHVFLLNGMSSLAPLLADRHNKPSKPLLLKFLADAIGSVLIITTTVIFKSKWCVIWGMLYGPAVMLVLSYTAFANSVFRFHLDKSHAKQFFQWSKYIMPSSILTLIITQSDKAILGKLMGVEMLGLYFIALNLSSTAEGFVINFARRIIGPALAEKKHSVSDSPEFLVNAFYHAKNKTLCLISVGLGLACSFSPLIVKVVYDERYAFVSVFLSILLVKPTLHLISYPIESLLMVKGFAKVTLQGNIIRILWIIISFYPFYHYLGEIGAVIAFVTKDIAAAAYFLIAAKTKGLLRLKYELLYVGLFGITFLLGAAVEPAITRFIEQIVPI